MYCIVLLCSEQRLVSNPSILPLSAKRESYASFTIASYILYPLYFFISYFVFDIHISPSVEIGASLYIHNKNVILHDNTKCGSYLSLFGPLTVGINFWQQGETRIGNNVVIGTGARIIGTIEIGSNVIIGANAVVIKKLPNNVIAGGVPAKILGKYNNPFNG